ncbi:Uncharacterised protein [Staphylococcus devriesei]|nr:Uncharacterised protein [Staphylococcus devriesei]
MNKLLIILNIIAIAGIAIVFLTLFSEISSLYQFIIYVTTFLILLINASVYYFYSRRI